MYSIERLLHQMHLGVKRKPSGFEALAVNYTISQVASGMLAMFGVLFVYELGQSFNQGLLMVMLFFGLQRLVVGAMVPVVGKLIAKTGYRWMMLIGLIASAIKAWLLMQVTFGSWGILGLALGLGGLSIASYYQGYHGIFLDDNDDHRVGEQIGLLTLMGRMALIVSPALAGWLVEGYGFSMMFGVAMSLLIVSLTPLFLMEHHEHKQEELVLKRAVKLLTKKGGFGASTFWWHVENATKAFYWPIFLFLIVGSHLKFGVIVSLVMVLNSVAGYFAGRIYDQRPLRRGYVLAGGMVVVSNLVKYMSQSLALVVGADSINRLAGPFWWMKLRRKALLEGERVRAIVFAAAWEWAVILGYLVGLVAGYVLLRLTGDWRWMGVVAGVGGVMSTVSLKKNEK